jgi:hypothetical protein
MIQQANICIHDYASENQPMTAKNTFNVTNLFWQDVQSPASKIYRVDDTSLCRNLSDKV